jgi:5-methylcytosine-specific restriction endonuclease McrA
MKTGRPHWYSEADKATIKCLLDAGESYSSIGRRFDRQASQISLIAKREGWKSLDARKLTNPDDFSETHKVCTSCNKELPVSDFPQRGDRPGKHHAKCNSCYRLWTLSANSEWSKTHPEKILEIKRAYRKRSPEVYLQAGRKRRAEKQGSYSEPFTRDAIIERDHALCYFCQSSVDLAFVYPDPNAAVIHHIIPLSQGGPDVLDNVALAHNSCNGHQYNKLTRHVDKITPAEAKRAVIDHHYLHRAPNITYAFGLYYQHTLFGVVTFGTPSAPRVATSICNDKSKVIELSRLWLHDAVPHGVASWFISQALKALPPLIVVAYADTSIYDALHDRYHDGSVYKACSFNYGGQSRASGGWRMPNSTRTVSKNVEGSEYVPLSSKHRYWTVTGDRREKKALRQLVRW